MAMPTFKQEVSSKVNVLNTIVAASIPAIQAAGVELDPTWVGVIMGLLNIFLRHYTKKALTEK